MGNGNGNANGNGNGNGCEPGSHDFSVNFDLWFTHFHGSQKSREPVNPGSQITQAPKSFILNFEICYIVWLFIVKNEFI